MTNGEAINWIINISADIGKAEHHDLWHYEQALSEIKEMLEMSQPESQWIPCHDPSDLPKDKRIWITYECDVCGFVFRFVKDVVWDMTEWNDSVSGVVAYMPYVEPEPYEESGG